jgi:hypothetical protein
VDGTKAPSGDIVIKLPYAEAVVLAEMLWRWERDGTQERFAFEDQAEQRVLWDLTATFEPLIDQAFGDKYADVVAHSRETVRDPTER